MEVSITTRNPSTVYMRRLLSTTIFLGVFSAFLYVANLVVYEALAGIFSLTGQWQLVVLGVTLGVLSASFIFATILGMRYYNAFTRSYYFVTAIWMGSFVYFFLGSVVYGVLVILSDMPPTGVGEAIMLGALLVSAYGVFHARNIKVKEVEVFLPNLPAAWQGRRAVWVSDIHLGQLHGPSFARRVVEKVNALPHDIIFIGGDLYDGTGAPDIDELTAPLKAFAAPLGTYFITGNHEEFGDSGRFLRAVTSQGIHVLQDTMVEVEGMQLVGVDYHNASDAQRFAGILSGLGIDTQKPSILLKHEPKDLTVAQVAGISLQISGHTHLGQLWPLGYAAQLSYKGFAYGLKKLKDMQVYTSSGTGTWGPPMRVGTNGEIVVFTFKAT